MSARQNRVSIRKMRAVPLFAMLGLASLGSAWALPAPPTIAQLREQTMPVVFQDAGAIPDEFGYHRRLVSFEVAGLKEFALVVEPRQPAGVNGYPVLIVNHGTHPNPPQYGITKDGVDSRPGDYYRLIPYRYAAEGFLVIVPDYRGHNRSAGGDYTHGMLASTYYAQDVLAVLAGVGSLPRTDTLNVFMWGHSLGGDVTLRVLTATRRIRAAALWDAVGGTFWDQAYFYSRYKNPLADDNNSVGRHLFEEYQREIRPLGENFDLAGLEPLNYVSAISADIILHHSLNDAEVPYNWSTLLASRLLFEGKSYVFHTYAGSEHLLSGNNFDLAVKRDAAFFRARITQRTPADNPQ